MTYCEIKNIEFTTLQHCRKSLLFHNIVAFQKKISNNCFDVTVVSFNRAECCKLIGLLVLINFLKLVNKKDICLLVLCNRNGHVIDNNKKEIVKCFEDIGFQFDIETNIKVANFLHILLNLNNRNVVHQHVFKPSQRNTNTNLLMTD